MPDGRSPTPARPRRRWLRILRGLFLGWLTLHIVISIGMYFMQHKLMYHPRVAVGRTPADAGLEFEDVTLKTSDGETLHGWFVPAPNPRAVLLYAHGNAGNRATRVGTIAGYHRLGLSVFIFDYRGFGGSTGTPSEEGTYRDADAAWSYLTQQRGIAANEIVVYGRSLGGAIAAYLAQRYTPAGVVVDSAFTSLPDQAWDMYPYMAFEPFIRFKYPTEQYIANVACPVLVTHSREDTLIDFEKGERIFAAAPEPKQFLELSGGHNSGPFATGEPYEQALIGFVGLAMSRPSPVVH